ncbi:MAG: oligopeptide/dipeptide ABC transporter ATP-binding protein [Burkholderiaceae bacterium]|jgi:peptide/nickel transport system ATP-binding protein
MNLPSLPAAAAAKRLPEILVEVRNASRYFDVSPPWLNRLLERKPRQLLRAVDDVSFVIHRGETLGLVGESGSGKSTVARLLVGLYRLTKGTIVIEGMPVESLHRSEGRQLRRRVQMIFQDPYASLNPRWRVGRIIAEPLQVHKIKSEAGIESIGDSAQISVRVDALLRQVGLSPKDRNKFPHQFSGGQRQRISIARALATHPDFLICDEPTSALDVSVQAQVLNLMKDLQRDLGLTYLFISHNLAVVRHVANRVGVMYCGRIVELAPKESIFEGALHPYTRLLIEAIPDLNMTGRARVAVAGEVPNPINPPSGCTFHPRCPYVQDRCKKEVPQLRENAPGLLVACHGVAEARLPWMGATADVPGLF